MFLNAILIDAISAALRQYTNTQETIQLTKSVSGGSINQCYQLKYGKMLFFLKVNSALKFPGMFMAEAEGLKRIGSTKTIKVPDVIGFGSAVNEQFLILEWIDDGLNNDFSQQELGRTLANLHKNTNSHFGLDHENYMGSLRQSNKIHSSWTNFFINERLEPQLEIARQKGLIGTDVLKQIESLYEQIDSLYSPEKPALVHGDLWSGNYMINSFQYPILIDPAISYSNREVDIAMSSLFGGFQQSFYDAYHEVFPLQSGWKKRLDLWNIYPLLIHVNLFGGSYLGQVKQILKNFCSRSF